MQTLKDKLLLIFGIALVAWSFYTFWNKPAPAHYQTRQEREFTISNSQFPINENSMKIKNSKLEIGGHTIAVEVADTPEKRARGLSGREALPPNSGMLFIFETPGIHSFWMKGMEFAIDIVWIDENLAVIGVERGVKPETYQETYPESFAPPSPAKFVLELAAGEADRLGIDIGSALYFDNIK